jgi:hypothetical protein
MASHFETALRLESSDEDGIYVVRGDYGNDVRVRVGVSKVFDDLRQVGNGLMDGYAGPGIWIKKLLQFEAEDEYGTGKADDRNIEREDDAQPEMDLKVHAPEQ